MSLFKVLVFAMLTIIMVTVLSIAVSMSQTYEAVTHPQEYHECNYGEYQMDVLEDGVMVYDGNRTIGFLPWSDSPLDKLIFKDNE